jgi:hypothetical protein
MATGRPAVVPLRLAIRHFHQGVFLVRQTQPRFVVP